ncbi:MAG TPA: hypothetical protein VK400_00150 [Pyrinomonadaceae bacterium]|nr:hypothetical protein [Pyrinomonadaceae bacterium]
MKEKHIQILGVCLTALYGLFVAWLYVAEPKSLTELPTKAQQTIDKATTTAQVMTSTYEIDRAKFDEGLQAFRQDNFVLARDAFSKADTERRDARAQFYIAYSFYRQGWGRVSNDDALFRQGLETVNHAIALDNNFKSDDAGLQLKTPVELKAELEQGLQVSAEDFNPLKVFRERK